ncbi:O-antigen ligase family protein [Streptococcus pluranimalium]|uniref:O-antigen ligase family protein n=1 Tax=Streptococcus pluranimalium TaxID=82348 RepID=UPI003F68F995
MKENSSSNNILLNNLPLTKISFITLVLLITLFGAGEFKVPSFTMSVSLKYIILTLSLVFSCIFDKARSIYKFKIDIVSILLFIHLLWNTILIFISHNNDFLFGYFAYVFAFLVYLWASNSLIDIKTYKLFLYSFISIIIVQTLITVYFISNSSIELYLFKSSIVIPVGASNGITTFVVLISPILYKLSNSKLSQYLLLLIVFMFGVLSRSNSGMISILGIIFFLLYQEKNYKVLRFIFIGLGFLLFLFLLGKYFPGYLNRFTTTIQSLFSQNGDMQTTALNGRNSVFQAAFQKFKSHLLLGNGFQYRDTMPSKLMSHNWILEYAVTGGMISLVIKSSIFITLYSKISRLKHHYLKEGLLIGMTFSLFQGLVEPSFGSPLFELIFGLVIGFGINTYASSSEIIEYNK